MIELKLTVEEVNIVLNALAARPYGEVFQLVNKIQNEGSRQLDQSVDTSEST